MMRLFVGWRCGRDVVEKVFLGFALQSLASLFFVTFRERGDEKLPNLNFPTLCQVTCRFGGQYYSLQKFTKFKRKHKAVFWNNLKGIGNEEEKLKRKKSRA